MPLRRVSGFPEASCPEKIHPVLMDPEGGWAEVSEAGWDIREAEGGTTVAN